MAVSELDPLLHTPDDTYGFPGTPARQEGVKTHQPVVNAGSPYHGTTFTDEVIENIVTGIIALALVAYLVYALVNPDRF